MKNSAFKERLLPTKTLSLGSLAFYWRMTDAPRSANSVPYFLPFSFGFDVGTQLITQEPDQKTLDTLRQTYLLDSNIGYMQEGHALADKYGLDFLDFVERALEGRGAKSVLDVGCGGCYMLKALKDRGFDVHGIDPGPLTQRLGERLEIPISIGFYPFDHGFGKMDLIFSSGVLEHVPDPVKFLRSHHQDLEEGGCIIVSTPDNEPSIELGDISMVLHEHLSYFDQESLRRTVEAAGFDVVSEGKARYGQSLYCCATPAAGARPLDRTEGGEFQQFSDRVGTALSRFEDAVGPLLNGSQQKVGFYVPLRALPYLSVMKNFANVRFFDDDPGTHKRYFDGFDVAVENWEDFTQNPPRDVVIMSLPHAEAIKAKILERADNVTTVYTLADILAGVSA